MKSVTNAEKSFYFVFRSSLGLSEQGCVDLRRVLQCSSKLGQAQLPSPPPEAHTVASHAAPGTHPVPQYICQCLGYFLKLHLLKFLMAQFFFIISSPRWFRRYTAMEPIQYGNTPFWTQPQWWVENGRPTLRTSCSELPLFSSDGGVICLDIAEWSHLSFMFLVTQAQTSQSS